ncbi:MAG: hypothetical protein JNN03_16320 [Rubrivivax sp.]|nr:hypothetical protein [Rubrivivax sp.]
MFEHLPLIVIEVFFVFGGALAFAWWQLRDLDRERRRREERQGAVERERAQRVGAPPGDEVASGDGRDDGPSP